MSIQTRLSYLLLAALLPFSASAHPGDDGTEGDTGSASEHSHEPDPLVARMLDAKKTPYKIDDDGDYRILVNVDDDRTQVVWVRSIVHETEHQKIREIWTYGMRSDERRIPVHIANQLLSHSFSLKLGAWVRDGGDALFVIKIDANANADVLDEAIDLAAYTGDEMEQKLGSGDDL